MTVTCTQLRSFLHVIFLNFKKLLKLPPIFSLIQVVTMMVIVEVMAVVQVDGVIKVVMEMAMDMDQVR